MPASTAKPRVLFVDDERRIIEVYADIFAPDYEVHVAASGAEALQKLRQLKNVAVVMSDLHMPQMDGATFLQEVMNVAPLTTRILLTGTSGVTGAKDAVNKGQIFRFLTKPCPLDQLRSTIAAGVNHHRLLNAERMVMQETLIECISALMEVLAVTNPVAFGRAERVKGIVQRLARWMDSPGFWQLEAAALLSQLGYFSVNPELAEKMYYGRELSEPEKIRAATIPANARRLLEHIPRLEPVIQILAALEWTDEQLARLGDGMVALGARILGAALEYDLMTIKGLTKSQILAAMQERKSRYGAPLLGALGAMIGVAEAEVPDDQLEIPLKQATPGMRLRQEIRTSAGALLVPIGIEVTARLLDRISQVAPEALDQKVKLAPAPPAPKNN